MLTFRMDETNFAQGARDDLRIVEGQGLKVDFDEFAPDGDTLGLWHLHDGACVGEGTGLEDASGGGHDFTNHGAESAENGYRFVRADGDYLKAAFPDEPARPTLTFEFWAQEWTVPVDTWSILADYRRDYSNRLLVWARRYSNPRFSRIDVELHIGGAEVGFCTWYGSEVDDLLAGTSPWHLAVVLNASEWMRLFVNGLLRDEDTTDIAALPAGDYNLWVGGVNGYYASVVLDEVRLSTAARYADGFTVHRLLASGSFESPTFDATRNTADWIDLDRLTGVPDGCQTTWEVRAADETDAGGHPQALWQAYDGDPQTLPDGRYFQWRATLSADNDRLASPTVESVEAIASEAGYDLYLASGAGPDVLDYADPWLRVGPSVAEAETDALAAGAVHWFGIRPVDADGRQSPVTQNEVRLELDADGAPVPDRPAAPVALCAKPLPLGQVRLRWHYRIGHTAVAPEAFRIFGDGGTGIIDYETPLGEVTFRTGQTSYAWTSSVLAPDLDHQLTVRAVAAGDVWDETPAVVLITPDASPPGTVDALTAETTQ